MVIDLQEILNADGEVLKFSRMVTMPNISYMGQELRFANEIEVVGQAKNTSGVIEIYATIKGAVIMNCARCTKDTVYKFSVPYSDSFEISHYNDASEPAEINLEDIITETVLCDIPMRILCSESCKGLCPKCGADLNETDCGCPSRESDLIWEKLKNLNLKGEV